MANRLVSSMTPPLGVPIPEPAELYSLIGLTFVLHVPLAAGDSCGQCGEAWPCPRVRLAFRMREGF